jgi:threonine dehydratase
LALGKRHFCVKPRSGSCRAAPWAFHCAEVWLKLEHLQVGGSFKARGMLNRLLANPMPASGVIVASGGNAGIATAAAARALGVACEVFVPEVSPEAKRARLRDLGATVVVTGASYAEAFEACVARQQQTGALMTHAYDQSEVVAGAGTLAQEIEAQGGRAPDSVLVSVGGGGLIGGVAAWFEQRCRVVALEPEGAPTLVPRPRGRAAGGRGGGRHRGRFAGGAAHRRHRLGRDRSSM